METCSGVILSENSMELISIRDVLSHPEENLNWFYLPPNSGQWNLDTLGIFSLDSREFAPDANEYLPEQVKKMGWIETLDAASIEDVVENAKEELENPSINQLFDAFIFYYENDAFLEFEN